MSRRNLLLALTVVIALATIASPFQRDLFVGDETKYSQVIHEMRQNGQFLVPTLEGNLYTHKPPGHFWMIWALTQVFGENSTFPFVIPSIVAFALILFVINRFTADMFDGETAAYASFIFATFYLAWGLAQTSRMDMTFHLLGTLAIWHLYRFFRDERTRDLVLAGVAIGFSILIKGPMTLVIFLLFFAMLAFRQRRVPKGNYLLAILVMAVIPLAWLIPALIQGGNAYAEELLIKQNVGRAVGSWVHREPPWWYLQRFPLTFLPWFFSVLVALIAAWRGRRADYLEKARVGFLVRWIIAIVLPFSVISGKLDIYMLPAMIPAAILLAAFITAPRDERLARLATIGNRFVLGIIGFIFGLIPILAPRFYGQEPDLRLAELPHVRTLFILTAIVAFTLLAVQWKRKEGLPDSVIALGVGALFPIVYLAFFLMPLANGLTSTRPIVEALQRQKVPGPEIGLLQAPHLWSKRMPADFHEVVILDSVAFREGRSKLTTLVVVRLDRAHLLGDTLKRRYVKVDEVRTRGKTFALYRRRV